MLFGHHPHELKPGQNVLVWGASGGLGVFAIQLANTAGANAIGVISDEDKRDFVMGLGAKGVINRKDFNCWGQLPKVEHPEYKEWFTEARKFGKAIWDITGKGVNVDMVFEHPGEATFPVSTFVCKRGGMVVICAGTTGFNCTFDVRYMWMHQKAPAGLPFRASQAGRLGQQADGRAPPRPLHVRGLPVGGTAPGASEDAPQRAQAGEHERAGAGPAHGSPDAGRRAGGRAHRRLKSGAVRFGKTVVFPANPA
jgi:threonine dehydrogenase-like Zn-dependent dehydrogenase